MTIRWLAPQPVYSHRRWAIAAHGISEADFIAIIEHPVVFLSTAPDKLTQYTEIVLDDYCTQRWGVDYTADLLMTDVEAGKDGVRLAPFWHDAISPLLHPVFTDYTDTSTWQDGERGWYGDEDGFDDGWRGDGWAA